MGVVRAALVKDGLVDNVILVDPEQGADYTPSEGYELVVMADGVTVDLGDRYESGKFYRKLWAWAESNPVASNEAARVIAELPPDTPDTVVIFQVADSLPVDAPVQNGRADAFFAFLLSGTYVITVSSERHGSATVEVVVQ